MRNFCADFVPGCDGVTSVSDEYYLPINNAAQPATRIGTHTFTTGDAGFATLHIFDAAGRQAAVLFSGKVEAGVSVAYVVPAKDLAAGLYILKLQCKNTVAARRLSLLIAK